MTNFSQIGFLSIISLNAMVPLALAALGEIFAEKAGVVNIGLEGVMLVGAWFGIFATWLTFNPFIGIAMGFVLGAVLGLIHGYISVYLRGDQIISGVGINLFALGFVPFSIVAVWGVAGAFSSPVAFPLILTPWGQLSYWVPITFVVAIVLWYILQKTRFGLTVRAAGENPEAADAVGINVERLRLFATIFGSALAGLAGSYMSVDLNGAITKEIVAGRGFIALATVVFSGWNPLLGVVGALIFGFAQGGSIWISFDPSVRNAIPNVDFVLSMVPYIATLVVVAALGARSKVPKYVGIPYKRE